MKVRIKRRARVNEEERQMVLALVCSLYADIEDVPRKPPTPERPKLAVLKRAVGQ